MNKSKRGNKSGLVWDEIGKWVIALVVLVILVIFIMMLRKGGINILDQIKTFLRFGR